MLPEISGEFGVVQAPDLRFSDDGSPWVKVRGVAKDRKFNKETNEWVDGDLCYLDILIGGKPAENLCESITVGDILTVKGRLVQREWQDKEGKTQKSFSLRADYLGVGLRFNAAPTPKTLSENRRTPAAQTAPQSEEAPF